VEGKIFFSVLAKRVTSYMTENGYVDSSLWYPLSSGCQENIGALSQMIQQAKASKNNLTVIWLDLANAYGAIPHTLIYIALDPYHIPLHIKGIITSYLSGIQLQFKTAHFRTWWQNLEKGLVTTCTISPILFDMGMNRLITVGEKPIMKSGI